jgi:hypothetical protein
MVKRKFKLNILDAIAVLLIVATACIGLVSYHSKPFLGDKNVLVEVKISNAETIDAVLPKVREAKEVYYSGTRYPVEQTSYRTEDDSSGHIKYLYITLIGLGKVSDKGSIFNGQRIYVNQKVEIRSEYQAQGYVVDYRYETE